MSSDARVTRQWRNAAAKKRYQLITGNDRRAGIGPGTVRPRRAVQMAVVLVDTCRLLFVSRGHVTTNSDNHHSSPLSSSPVAPPPWDTRADTPHLVWQFPTVTRWKNLQFIMPSSWCDAAFRILLRPSDGPLQNLLDPDWSRQWSDPWSEDLFRP